MIFNLIILFIVGTIFGSFLSVLIYRIHSDKKGIFFGRSQCPACKKKLSFCDLIPLFSYLGSLGRCRHCKKPIGVWYFILEMVCGLILAGLYLKFPFSEMQSTLIYIYYAVISLSLIGIFFFDLKYMEIPELFTIPVMVLILIASIFLPTPGILNMAIGGAAAGIFFGFQVVASKEQWMGAGDTQVGIILGMLFGWQYLIMCLLIAYLFGSLISILLLVGGKVTGKTRIPFAPFLVTAGFIVIFFGDSIYKLYESTLL
ncbi:prepilin peptidase [Candidatus Peregrinibacteria bacterium]|nr:prepilin peptidase [Candidatus Peregrinibacteria bacterium]